MKIKAWKFIVLFGVVSLLADVTYEGARSVSGQYLEVLGAGATAVGVVAGLGEFIGYALRLAAGFLADRTGRYWLLTFVGYTVNVVAVPALALAGRWEIAAALLFVERFGKALRTPARDAMLSHASSQTGRGMAFGIHEALDQTGAILGPLLMALVLHWGFDYRIGFLTLLVPAFLTLFVLVTAWHLYPQPQRMETSVVSLSPPLTSCFWRYLLFTSFAVAGFPHFPLLAYHFKTTAVFPEHVIPGAFGLAMATDAVAALAMGRWFDRFGLRLLIVIPFLTFLAAFAGFTAGGLSAWLAMILWGIVIGAQESVMRAAVAHMTLREKRASAYGIFNAAFGLAWMLGGAVMGVLYDLHRIDALILLIAISQLASVPFLLSAIALLKTGSR